jgi:hypothetical protein
MRGLVMKSEVDLELLQEYLDGDADAEEALFARYERDLLIPADLWAGIEKQLVPATSSHVGWWVGIAAGLLLTVGLLSMFLLSRAREESIAALKLPQEPPANVQRQKLTEETVTQITPTNKPIHADRTADNPGVLSLDVGVDLDEQETAKHIEQTENLLRSIRNVTISDSDDEVDVSYDKALSRRLLIENVVLRRDAEMKAKFPTKTLLADLEPFLIDIANLPDRAKPEDLRAIKERVQKTEIVAALVDYQDRGTDKR